VKTVKALQGCVLTFAAALAAPEASAQGIGASHRFGLGVVLGYPFNGLSMNYFLERNMSLQIDPTLRLYNHRGVGFGVLGARVDLLFYPATLATGRVAHLRFYVGPGANIALGLGAYSGFYLAAEAAVGLAVHFQRAPVDLALEFVPVLAILNGGGVDVGIVPGGAFHARYYF
jgi:hypothetical protein